MKVKKAISAVCAVIAGILILSLICEPAEGVSIGSWFMWEMLRLLLAAVFAKIAGATSEQEESLS